MNWGWKLALVYVGFMAMILTLVFKASSQKIELVTPDYYEQEVAYQKRIDAIANTRSLSSAPVISGTRSEVVIQFPAECSGAVVTGECLIYRPSDSGLDLKVPVTPDVAGKQTISGTLSYGQYIVQLSWEMAGKTYYFEHVIFIA